MNYNYMVYDYFLNGKVQMVSGAREVTPLLKQGYAVYYNEQGYRTSRGYYDDNKQSGNWVHYFDNEKDSSLYSINNEGKWVYSRKCKAEEEEEKSNQKDIIYTITEVNAEFPGGITQMAKYIQTNLIYPKNARNNSYGGKCFLKFVVNIDGTISESSIIKTTGFEELDKEAMRVVNEMPIWKPAEMSGKKVRCYFNLPINFAMDTPYFIFNPFNKNEKYIIANKKVLENNLNEALNYYYEDFGDIEAWYNIGVIHYLKKNKKESKNHFENILNNINDSKNQYYVASSRFLQNNF
ncbi:MAG: energy transducer TonB [Bacteroidota bacterium]